MKVLLFALAALLLVGVYFHAQTQQPAFTLQSMNADNHGIPDYVVSQFNSWKAKYNKHFGSQEDETYRLQVFFGNLLYIDETNSVQSEYTLSENEFMDLTTEEFAATYLGNIAESEGPSVAFEEFAPSNAAAFNWATKNGVVTPVKNQGSCGSCWAFSTTGVVEGYWGLNKGSLPNLSEQQLVDCAGIRYGNLGCNGGNPGSALGYVRDKGLVTEQEYPYKGRQGNCKINEGPYKIGSVKKTSGCSALTSDINSQPTSVAVDASNWQFYSGGVFSNCQKNLNHAVLATGWDSSSNWIIKNSWGTSWGNKGYITLKTGDTCGVCQQLSNAY